jgi:hypothetical protein
VECSNTSDFGSYEAKWSFLPLQHPGIDGWLHRTLQVHENESGGKMTGIIMDAVLQSGQFFTSVEIKGNLIYCRSYNHSARQHLFRSDDRIWGERMAGPTPAFLVWGGLIHLS